MTPRDAAAPPVDHDDAVHGNLEPAVLAANHIQVGLKLAARKPRRHTGGVNAGDSNAQ